VSDDEVSSSKLTHPPAATHGAAADKAGAATGPDPLPRRRALSCLGGWLSIFTLSLGLFAVRLLFPSPVGMADNHDGLRLTCSFGLAAVTGGQPRWFRYAYFRLDPSPLCAGRHLYPSSQHLLLDAARWLTGVLGLPGTLNLIALGLLTCAIAAVGIASLAMGLRLRPLARVAVAAAAWLVMADSAFFGVDASPFSESATLVGLLLVAAGAVYLGRGGPATAFGLLLAGSGGALAIASKEQYVIVFLPICLTLVLASAVPGGRAGLRRFLALPAAAAAAVAAILTLLAASYLRWDSTSWYAGVLHREQAVNVTFKDIVTGRHGARAALRSLGLPARWARYAGHGYFSKLSVRHDPLYARYGGRLTASNNLHFLLTHPLSILVIGQRAAGYAMAFRETYLGNYAPSAGHPAGALESRVQVISWLVRAVPSQLGLLWLVPLWAAMAATAIAALRDRDGAPWRRDAAIGVLCMTGCGVTAFVPAAYFDSSATTRHMLGANLATALAFSISAALAISMLGRTLPWEAWRLRRRELPAVRPGRL
jgi:hypothetical protein